MRKEEARAPGQKRIKYILPSLILTFGRTCEVIAVIEVHFLHALGKHELVDGACGKEGEKKEKDKMRNEGCTAAAPQVQIKRQFPSHVPVIRIE